MHVSHNDRRGAQPLKPPFCFLIFLTVLFVLDLRRAAAEAPLPDPQQLRERAIANMKKSEKDLEKYSCIVHEDSTEMNADGSMKRPHSKIEEQFFVNGVEIDHTISKDGKELTAGEARKEQSRADKDVKKYSDPEQARKSQVQDEKQWDTFLHALRFTNGHREMREGRSTIVYDMVGDPNFHPRKLEERFAKALKGRIWIDEESGMPLEIRLRTERDVKIGGGLLANLHKGFWLHLLQQREPDGVWITKVIEGAGDARAGLLFHSRFQFKQELDKCHLYSVDTKVITQNPTEKANHQGFSKP